jgi:hypothetical protein
LTQVGLKTQQEFGMGNPGVANWFGGDEDAVGVILNAGDKEKDKAKREYPGSTENDGRKEGHWLLFPCHGNPE